MLEIASGTPIQNEKEAHLLTPSKKLMSLFATQSYVTHWSYLFPIAQYIFNHILQAFDMNAHIMPEQPIFVKNEPIEIEIKQEKDGGEVNNPVAVNGVTDSGANEFQSKIDSLAAEKTKLIADLLSLKADNQRIYYESQKKDALLQQTKINQKEEKAKFEEVIDALKIKVMQNEVTENDLIQKLALTERQLLETKKENDENTIKADRLFKENRVLQARIKQIQTCATPKPVERAVEPEQKLFAVDHILDHKIKYKKRQFLVRWDGFDETHDTWEPEKNVKHLKVYRNYLKNNHF